MLYSFLRFLCALIVLLAASIYLLTGLSQDQLWMGVLFVFLLVVPIVSFLWSSFARRCYKEEVRTKSPFLYALGMLFGVPQKVLGLIFFLIGSVWIYSFLIGSVKLSGTTIGFSSGLLVLGASWLINTALHAWKTKTAKL